MQSEVPRLNSPTAQNRGTLGWTHAQPCQSDTAFATVHFVFQAKRRMPHPGKRGAEGHTDVEAVGWQRAGALNSQHGHVTVQLCKGGWVGPVGIAQHKALPVQPEGEGGNEAAASHSGALSNKHCSWAAECQPASFEILKAPAQSR